MKMRTKDAKVGESKNAERKYINTSIPQRSIKIYITIKNNKIQSLKLKVNTNKYFYLNHFNSINPIQLSN